MEEKDTSGGRVVVSRLTSPDGTPVTVDLPGAPAPAPRPWQHPLVARARDFAKVAHGDQERQWTGEPYWYHLSDVAQRVELLTDDVEVIAAAWLHDTLEDTETTLPQIQDEFGPNVAWYVVGLTDVYTHEAFPERNRKWRKQQEAQRLSVTPWQVRLIKLCDVQSNAESIEEHGGGFAEVWKAEKKELVRLLLGI